MSLTQPLRRLARPLLAGTALATLSATAVVAKPVAGPAPATDVLIRGGSIYDGSGGDPYVGDVLIKGDPIVAVTRGASGATAIPVGSEKGADRASDLQRFIDKI